MSDPDSRHGVTPRDLLTMIGELTVENRLLRERLAVYEQNELAQNAKPEKEEVHAGN